jgi:hypothetical protein
MPSAVIVVGAVEGVRRDLERHLGDRAELLIIRLGRSKQGAFQLEAHPETAARMVEVTADRADGYASVFVVQLPYAACPSPLNDTVTALEDLGATVIRPRPGSGRWPARPPALDHRFRLALIDALLSEIGNRFPGDPPPESIADALARARGDFAETLQIPQDVTVDTSLDGGFWYRALRALHELCEAERRGEATNKRNILRDLLAVHINLPKHTYKIADTGIFAIDPTTGKRIELRERVHIVEGRPTETESIYWITIGDGQASYQYLIGRIGRHA